VGGCLSVMLGPADNLAAVSAAEPIYADDKAQTTATVTLLMKLAAHFIGADAPFLTGMQDDISTAQANQQALNKRANGKGYLCRETYDPQSKIVVVTISKLTAAAAGSRGAYSRQPMIRASLFSRPSLPVSSARSNWLTSDHSRPAKVR